MFVTDRRKDRSRCLGKNRDKQDHLDNLLPRSRLACWNSGRAQTQQALPACNTAHEPQSAAADRRISNRGHRG